MQELVDTFNFIFTVGFFIFAAIMFILEKELKEVEFIKIAKKLFVFIAILASIWAIAGFLSANSITAPVMTIVFCIFMIIICPSSK